MPILSLLVALAQLSAAGAQPSAPLARPSATTVHLMTVVAHPDVLGGQRVMVPVARVVRVIGPTLVIVGQPRVRGNHSAVDIDSRYDKLLVLLPGPTALSEEQVIAITGTVRTVAGARASGLRVDQPQAQATKKAKRQMRWPDKTPLLVADSVETTDGVLLGGVQ